MTTCPVCDTKLPIKGKPRSYDQHKRFFAMCLAAYHHWPEQHEEQFSNAEDCRKYLTMKAGWRDIASKVTLSGIREDKAILLATAVLSGLPSNLYARPVLHKGQLIVWVPRSISYATMPHLEFCALSDAVQYVIEAETGAKIDDLMREAA